MPPENVSHVQELDLSPVVLGSVALPCGRLKFRDGPRGFALELDAEGQLLVIRDSELDIHAFGQSRAEVLADLQAQIAVAWREYVEADEGRLTPGAAALRKTLLRRLTEHHDDA